MSWRRTKSPGWAAFDLQQKQKKQGQGINNDPFPALPSSSSSSFPSAIYYAAATAAAASNNNATMTDSRPFSSVTLPSAAPPQPSSIDNKMNPSSSSTGGGSSFDQDEVVFRRLKELYSWADDSLIQDLLAAVNCDFDKAALSLKAMVVSDNRSLVDHNGQDSLRHFESPSKCLQQSVPIEPEWEEEEDIYLNHRKDAIRIIRAASRHSKAASNSFLRGDHFAARHLSQKARDEWAAAENLHGNAAREILNFRNDRNGIWKLDLHGLHSSEAVNALRERLSLIESRVSSKGPLISNNSSRISEEAGNGLYNGTGHHDVLTRQRPLWLEVITGVGNHSRGEAAIPAAVTTFLLNNRYRFDEGRPGIVMVRPKFRHYTGY